MTRTSSPDETILSMRAGSNRAVRAVKKAKESVHGEKNVGGSGISKRTNKTAEIIKKLDDETRTLRGIVKNRSTKDEIKQLSKIFGNLLNELTSTESEEEAVVESSKSESEITSIEDKNVETYMGLQVTTYKTISTQIEDLTWQIKKMNTKDIRRKDDRKQGVRKYSKISSTEWPQDAYIKVREVMGDPTWEGNESDLGVFIERDNEMKKGITKQIKRRFPVVEEIHRMEEGCATVVYKSKIMTSKAEDRRRAKKSLSRILLEQDDMKLYMNILAWKDKIKELKIRRVAICVMEERWKTVKSMIEHVFCEDNIQIMAYSSAEVSKESKREQGTTEKRTENRGRGWETEAVVVTAAGRQYEQLVKTVKEKVDVQKLGINLRSIRCTRKGDLLLTLDKNEGGADRLGDEIRTKLGEEGTGVRKGGESMTTIHLRGLDITATVEELKTLILSKIRKQDAQVTVKSIRPAYGRTQNATVELLKEDEETLINEGSIRIGWSLCRVSRRVEVLRCTKCWRLGHRRRDCQVTDRTALCLKCAKEGHKVKECPNDPSCPICGKEGHRADSALCTAYGEALRKEIMKRQEKTTEETHSGKRVKEGGKQDSLSEDMDRVSGTEAEETSALQYDN